MASASAWPLLLAEGVNCVIVLFVDRRVNNTQHCETDRGLTRIIHRGWAELREAVRRSVVFGGVEDADNRGLKLRRGVCSGASGPVVYGGSLAIRPARLAKLVCK